MVTCKCGIRRYSSNANWRRCTPMPSVACRFSPCKQTRRTWLWGRRTTHSVFGNCWRMRIHRGTVRRMSTGSIRLLSTWWILIYQGKRYYLWKLLNIQYWIKTVRLNRYMRINIRWSLLTMMGHCQLFQRSKTALSATREGLKRNGLVCKQTGIKLSFQTTMGRYLVSGCVTWATMGLSLNLK